MRLATTLLIPPLVLAWCGSSRAASDEAKPKRPAAATPAERPRDRPGVSPAEREALALAFVREHHPELAPLLEQLKAMRPGEYDRAIAELFQVSRSLTNLKRTDARRYEAGLALWKAKSEAQLLAARWVNAPSDTLERQLRAALKAQLDAEIRQQELERELVRERFRRVEETIRQLNSSPDSWVESRLKVLKNKGQRNRRGEEARPAPPRPTRAKGDRKA